MTTLRAIGFNLLVGVAVLLPMWFLFGCAVRKRHPFVAPRAIARPPEVTYDPDARAGAGKEDDDEDDEDEAVRRGRGNPWTGWIGWVLSLSYAVLMDGVPGTGTGNGGRSGAKLKVNLDEIVLLRFHELCLRCLMVISAICLIFLLPIYHTAPCYEESDMVGCNQTYYSLTDYERTTIANVPSLQQQKQATHGNVFYPAKNGHLARLYGAVFCFWIMIAYTLYEIHHEWIQLVALRRVYYLEDDVWGERRLELEQSVKRYAETQKKKKHRANNTNNDAPEQAIAKPVTKSTKERYGDAKQQEEQDHDPEIGKTDVQGARDCSRRDDTNDAGQRNNNNDWTEDVRRSRERPWIPDPQQRETIPNICLYSVLIGGIPSLPHEIRVAEEEEEQDEGDGGKGVVAHRISREENARWQLDLTTDFFDRAVPNEPGFSSSVAAVTLFPAETELATAWKKWSTEASAVRRLRFIRKQIQDRRADEDYCPEGEGEDEEEEEEYGLRTEVTKEEEGTHKNHATTMIGGVDVAAHETKKILNSNNMNNEDDNYFEALQFPSQQIIDYPRGATVLLLQDALSSFREEEDVHDVFMTGAPSFGPEQGAVYTKEYAQVASGCCPVGRNEKRVRRATLEELLKLEKEAEEEVRQASLRLREAQCHLRYGDDVDIKKGKGGEAELTISIDSTTKCEMLSKARGLDGLGVELSLCRDATATQPNEAEIEATPANEESAKAKAEYGRDDSKWARVETAITEARHIEEWGRGANIPAGVWSCPRPRTQLWTDQVKGRIGRTMAGCTTSSAAKAAVDLIAGTSTYAVVTFTSRSAAVAARQCLADGRGAGRWKTLPDIPIPPLADSPAGDCSPGRNCCRPVTLSLTDREKVWRKRFTILLLASIYIFYMVPLSIAQSLVDPSKLSKMFPGFEGSRGEAFINTISGLLVSLIYMGFVCVCPTMFQAIANFGSNATSVAMANHSAIQYYWWFMLITSFSGTLLLSMAIQAINTGLSSLTTELRNVIRSIALTIPSNMSFTWLNWTITQSLITFPMNYLLQFPAFLYWFLGSPCLARTMIGGGAGGPVPVRIYVNAGVVLMCGVALAPQSPLVSFSGLLYFLVSQPVLRWLVIFHYRPKYDGGGMHWPFLTDMCISAMVLGEVLLTAQMALKAAAGPAFFAFLTIIPTILFRTASRARYLRSFQDAALFQASGLDGSDVDGATLYSTENLREEFRRFLVDAHKASYLPICLAGGPDTDHLTAEPAVVVPSEAEFVKDPGKTYIPSFVPPSSQKGATMRRALATLTLMQRQANAYRFSYTPSLASGDVSDGQAVEDAKKLE